MDEQTFQRKMADLIERIRDLPGTERPTKTSTRNGLQATDKDNVRDSVEELQESLDYLRLSVKYLVFDLEATRRENAYLRRLVEQANRERNNSDENEKDVDDLFE